MTKIAQNIILNIAQKHLCIILYIPFFLNIAKTTFLCNAFLNYGVFLLIRNEQLYGLCERRRYLGFIPLITLYLK